MSPRTYARRLSAVLDAEPITGPERHRAEAWYTRARVLARQVADRLDVDPETGAAIVAAFSIRNTWADNVAHALAYADGVTPPGLRQRVVIADACLTQGIDALRGPKTSAFASAIAGDDTAVPVDVWMCRAAGLRTNSPTARQHDEIGQAVRTLARRHGMAPSAMQALIWTRVRGAHE